LSHKYDSNVMIFDFSPNILTIELGQ